MGRSIKICEFCNREFVPSHSSVRFCSNTCNQDFRRKFYVVSNRTREKRSLALKQYFRVNGVSTKGPNHSLIVGKATKGRIGKVPTTLFECSKRTIRKILGRLQLSCSRCGWDEGICDLHHIRGRKIENSNHHSNITYICPNCHRLFHEGKINHEDVIAFDKHVGDRWLEFYYG